MSQQFEIGGGVDGGNKPVDEYSCAVCGHYGTHPDSWGHSWRPRKSEKPVESSKDQISGEAANKWVYGVYAWRGRSPQFMQTQKNRLAQVIKSAIEKGIQAFLCDSMNPASPATASKCEFEESHFSSTCFKCGESKENHRKPDSASTVKCSCNSYPHLKNCVLIQEQIRRRAATPSGGDATRKETKQ